MRSTQGKTGIGKVIQKTKAGIKDVKEKLKIGLNKINATSKANTKTKTDTLEKAKFVSRKANVGQRDFVVADASSTNDVEVNNVDSTSHSTSQMEIYDNRSLTHAGNILKDVSDSLGDLKTRFLASQLGVDIAELSNLQEYFANNGKQLAQITKELGVEAVNELGLDVWIDSKHNVHLLDSDKGTATGFTKVIDLIVKECESGNLRIPYVKENTNSGLIGNTLPDDFFTTKLNSGFDCTSYLNAALAISGNTPINFKQLQDGFADITRVEPDAAEYFCKISDLVDSKEFLERVNVGDILYTRTHTDKDGNKVQGHVAAVTGVNRETGIITYSDMGAYDPKNGRYGPRHLYMNANTGQLCDEDGSERNTRSGLEYLFRFSECPDEYLEEMDVLRQ